MIDRTLLTANDFIGVRAALVAELGNNADRALVLTRIFYRADERWREAIEADGHWWWRATRDTIAEETGLSIDQVKRIVSWLVTNGYVVSVAHQIEGKWDQTRSLRVDVAGSQDGRANAPAIGAESHRSIGAESQDLPTTKTVKTRDTTPRELTDFERFYAVWPRKVGRPAAERAFRAAIKAGTPVALILAGAAAYRRWYEVSGQDIKFVPYPATWLNREGWNDQLVWPDATRPKPPADRPRKLTAVERNMAEFERMHGVTGDDLVTHGGGLAITRGVVAVDLGTPVRPFPHHARVEQRLTHADAETYQVYIQCPECESEWAWRDDANGASADLRELATLHNSGSDR